MIIEKFLKYASEEDKKASTIRDYKTTLVKFAQWFNRTNEKEMTPEITTPLDIKLYKSYLQEQRLKPGTINQKLNTLRLFFRWCIEQEIIAQNPVERIKPLPKSETQAAKWLTRQETFALLRAVEASILAHKTRENEASLVIAKRNAAMVALMLHAGLRVSEVADLRVNDVQLGERSGKVIVRKGKRDKYREVPLNIDARKDLREWLKVKPGQSELFFEEPLHVRTIQYHLGRLGRAAGLKHLTPHQLRHTFGKNLVDTGTSLDKVARLMGHSDVNTTAIYTQPSELDLKSAVDKLSWFD